MYQFITETYNRYLVQKLLRVLLQKLTQIQFLDKIRWHSLYSTYPGRLTPKGHHERFLHALPNVCSPIWYADYDWRWELYRSGCLSGTESVYSWGKQVCWCDKHVASIQNVCIQRVWIPNLNFKNKGYYGLYHVVFFLFLFSQSDTNHSYSLYLNKVHLFFQQVGLDNMVTVYGYFLS